MARGWDATERVRDEVTRDFDATERVGDEVTRGFDETERLGDEVTRDFDATERLGDEVTREFDAMERLGDEVTRDFDATERLGDEVDGGGGWRSRTANRRNGGLQETRCGLDSMLPLSFATAHEGSRACPTPSRPATAQDTPRTPAKPRSSWLSSGNTLGRTSVFMREIPHKPEAGHPPERPSFYIMREIPHKPEFGIIRGYAHASGGGFCFVNTVYRAIERQSILEKFDHSKPNLK